MERAIAVKRLRKMLGDKSGYQINQNAPTPEQREAAKECQKELSERHEVAFKAAEIRRKHLLENDAEYQTLLAAAKETRIARDKNFSKLHHYKISVGTANSMFFHVIASADSW